MPTTTPNTPATLTDDALDLVDAGASKSMDFASLVLTQFAPKGFFRPNPAGDGTTQHVISSIDEGEVGL